jgi:hypothetical protein
VTDQTLRDRVGDAEVVTTFTGRDHQMMDGPPLLFETRVIGGPNRVDKWHWPTWEAAQAGHAAIVDFLAMPTESPRERTR